MAVYSKVKLSGSTDGKMIAVTQTASPGDTIHTADPSALDEVHIWAINTDSVARKLTIEFGGTATADQIELTIQPEAGLVLVIPGLLLTNSLAVKAFAASASKINLGGYVNRIT